MEVFNKVGLIPEPLREFANEFDINVVDGLNDIWIVHLQVANRENIITVAQIDKSRFGAPTKLLTPNNIFDTTIIIKLIINNFKGSKLVTYILENCYLYWKGCNGSFESIFHYPEVQNLFSQFIQQRKLKRKIIRNKEQGTSSTFKRARDTSPDLFENASKIVKKQNYSDIKSSVKQPRSKSTRISCLSVPNQILKRKVFEEQLSLNYCLYDNNYKRSLGLSENIVERIMRTPIVTEPPCIDDWTRVAAEWVEFSNIARSILKNAKGLEKNNGVVRIMRKYLNNPGGSSLLVPIEKNIVMKHMSDIVRRIIPKQMFDGQNRLQKKFLSKIKELINLCKDQTVLLSSFVDCFPRTALWYQQVTLCYQESLRIKFAKFLLQQIIFQVLKNTFFITETGSSGYELFYYTKPSIDSLCEKKLSELVNLKQWVRVSRLDNENREDSTFVEANVRFLPKKPNSDEIRPITTKAKVIKTNVKEYFQQKYMAKLWLDWAVNSYSSGIKPFPHDDRLNQAWLKIMSHRKETDQEVYFVKTDISDAFGSIIHDHLFAILDKLILKCQGTLNFWTVKEWLYREGTVVLQTRECFGNYLKPNTVLKERIISMEQQVDFNSIKLAIVNMVSKPTLKYGGRKFRVVGGLCQGGIGVFSTQLCAIYYTALDNQVFADLLPDKNDVLLRAVDDYLFVTYDRKRAVLFYERVCDGFPNFNIRFKTEKLTTNLFDGKENFLYLGLNFDVKSLIVEPDFSKYEGKKFLYSMKCSDKAGMPHFNKKGFVFKKMKSLAALKILKIIFCNENLDIKRARGIIDKICAVQNSRVLSLSLIFKLKPNEVIQVLKYCSVKLINSITKLNGLMARAEISLLFWQSAKSIFQENSGNFHGLQGDINSIIFNQEKILLNFIR